MERKSQLWLIGLGKTLLAGAALAGLLLFASSSPVARADDDTCQKRIARADHRLHEAIEHHGRDSHQADKARHDLHEAREDCFNRYHRWWDEDDHRWHSGRDWDDHDHDRDRDHP